VKRFRLTFYDEGDCEIPTLNGTPFITVYADNLAHAISRVAKEFIPSDAVRMTLIEIKL
jgi:hypothetical protein